MLRRGTAPAEAHAKGHGRAPRDKDARGKGPERLLRRREEMLGRGMPQAKANAAAELVRWLWALGMMGREAGE